MNYFWSYEDLIREAQFRVVEIKQEKDDAYNELEKVSCLIEDLQEKADYRTLENKTISSENVELKRTLKKLKESSIWIIVVCKFTIIKQKSINNKYMEIM